MEVSGFLMLQLHSAEEGRGKDEAWVVYGQKGKSRSHSDVFQSVPSASETDQIKSLSKGLWYGPYQGKKALPSTQNHAPSSMVLVALDREEQGGEAAISHIVLGAQLSWRPPPWTLNPNIKEKGRVG